VNHREEELSSNLVLINRLPNNNNVPSGNANGCSEIQLSVGFEVTEQTRKATGNDGVARPACVVVSCLPVPSWDVNVDKR